jgi:adenine-specific DNA-methyltransferase
MTVLSIKNGVARCTTGDGHVVEFPTDDLVALQKPGQRLYPSLLPVETVDRGGDAPAHVLIEGENHSALRLLGWTHVGSVDCIYIDPPYNTGATSWMYNNKIVDGNDAYRSSKWLAMMERRLKLAKPLLKEDGVLIVTIDENEVATLRMLLERGELFGGWDIHIVAIEHNPRGIQGQNFSVTNEFALFVVPPKKQLIASRRLPPEEQLSQPLRKWGAVSTRDTARNCFYPIRFKDGVFVGAGPVLPDDQHPEAAVVQLDDGATEFWPIDHNGVERKWRYARNRIDDIAANLRIKRGRHGEQVHLVNDTAAVKTVWRSSRYAAFSHGTKLVNDISGGRFPFPKSLYATYDCVDLVVRNRPEAIVLDFFGGSGTTLHSVAMMNAVDGGRRQCITVTNNEIAIADQKRLRADGHRPGDDAWENEGICRSITFPRLRNAVTGMGPDGTQLDGTWSTGRWTTETRLVALHPLDALADRAVDAGSRGQFAALMGLPASFKEPFHVAAPGSGDTAILFDPAEADAMIEQINEQASESGTHVKRIFYVPPASRLDAKALKDRLSASLPPHSATVEETRPFGVGLEANLAYVRLIQLDPDNLEAGRGLDDLLPTLWLMAGAFGRPPQPQTEQLPFIVPDDARFALLIDPAAFQAFSRRIMEHGSIDWVFVVADSAQAYDAVLKRLPISLRDGHAKRLYSSYLDNFTIDTND